MRPASALASASSASCGTILLTRPMRSASLASIGSPVISSSAAFAGPTMDGSFQKPPTSQTRPRLTKSSANTAFSEAMRMSA